jgi:hypothetical protein
MRNPTGPDKKKKNSGPYEGPGVNRVYVCRTSLAILHDSGVGCNTISPFARSRHYFSN